MTRASEYWSRWCQRFPSGPYHSTVLYSKNVAYNITCSHLCGQKGNPCFVFAVQRWKLLLVTWKHAPVKWYPVQGTKKWTRGREELQVCFGRLSGSTAHLWWSKVGNCKQGGQERPSKAPLQFCFEQVGRVSIPCVFDCPVPTRQSPLTVMTFAKWHTDIYSIKSRKTSFDMLLISLVFSLVCLFSISLLSSHYYFLPFACFGINLHFLFYPHKVEA